MILNNNIEIMKFLQSKIGSKINRFKADNTKNNINIENLTKYDDITYELLKNIRYILDKTHYSLLKYEKDIELFACQAGVLLYDDKEKIVNIKDAKIGNLYMNINETYTQSETIGYHSLEVGASRLLPCQHFWCTNEIKDNTNTEVFLVERASLILARQYNQLLDTDIMYDNIFTIETYNKILDCISNLELRRKDILRRLDKIRNDYTINETFTAIDTNSVSREYSMIKLFNDKAFRISSQGANKTIVRPAQFDSFDNKFLTKTESICNEAGTQYYNPLVVFKDGVTEYTSYAISVLYNASKTQNIGGNDYFYINSLADGLNDNVQVTTVDETKYIYVYKTLTQNNVTFDLFPYINKINYTTEREDWDKIQGISYNNLSLSKIVEVIGKRIDNKFI